MTLTLLLLLSISPVQRGATVDLGTSVCVGTELAGQDRAAWLNYRRLTRPDTGQLGLKPNWILVDSLFVSGELAPGQALVLSYEPNGESLELIAGLDTLPSVCRQAVEYAPGWLGEELTSAFRRLGDSAAFYAGLLLAIRPPYVDEVAFCIAGIGPQILTHRLFNPGLLLANAEQLYMVDDSLPYADIVDHGSPPCDYYSTVRYRVLDSGDTTELELPRDIYYHFVVHPTTSDEMPRLDGYVGNKHWREYYFFGADSGYPVLCDYIKRARVVWGRQMARLPSGRQFDPDDHALDVIGNWVDRTITSGASGNRPIHPYVIAKQHNGNCGEIQDAMTAACRTCLIPCVNASDPCEDHVWNEFWDRIWYPYALDRTTRVADSACGYEERHGGSKRISSVFNWRPDGYWWTVTGEYSLTCSLFVRVLDQRGLPLDAARVLVYSEGWYGGLDVTTIGFTDSEGAVAFELGDLRNYYLRVSTPLGDYPSPTTSVKVVNLSQSGTRYYKTVYLPAPLAAPIPEPVLGDSAAEFRLELDPGMTSGLEYGYCVARGAGTGDPEDSVRLYGYYSDQRPGPTADLFGLDTVGFNAYLAGPRFPALRLWDDTPSRAVSFTGPAPGAKYYLVLSNEDKVQASRWLAATGRLYVRAPGIAESGSGHVSRTGPTVVRGSLFLPSTLLSARYSLLTPAGRKVAELLPGTNDVRDIAPGVYFVRSAGAAFDPRHSTLPAKVLIAR